jgi:hypothetical protein
MAENGPFWARRDHANQLQFLMHPNTLLFRDPDRIKHILTKKYRVRCYVCRRTTLFLKKPSVTSLLLIKKSYQHEN